MICSRYDEGFVRGIILGPRSWTNLVNTPCYNSTTDSGQVTSAKHQYLPDFEIHFPFLIFICLKTCNTLLSCQGGKDVLVLFFCSKSFDWWLRTEQLIRPRKAQSCTRARNSDEVQNNLRIKAHASQKKRWNMMPQSFVELRDNLQVFPPKRNRVKV